MKPDERSFDQATEAFFSQLASHFRNLASAADLRIEPNRLSIVWEQGLFAAASGVEAKAAKGGGHDLGLIHISTPKSLPLLTKEKKDVPPGSYVIHVGEDASMMLKEVGSGISVPIAAPGTMSRIKFGDYICSTQIIVQIAYHECRVCITLVCWATWIGPGVCIDIPFCTALTGLFDP